MKNKSYSQWDFLCSLLGHCQVILLKFSFKIERDFS